MPLMETSAEKGRLEANKFYVREFGVEDYVDLGKLSRTMLRIRLDINGVRIGYIGVHNKQEYDDEGRVKYGVYDLRGWRKGDHITDHPKITTLWHDASDGAAALTARVMGEVGEDRLDKHGQR